jgi:hypothetical protein
MVVRMIRDCTQCTPSARCYYHTKLEQGLLDDSAWLRGSELRAMFGGKIKGDSSHRRVDHYVVADEEPVLASIVDDRQPARTPHNSHERV